ncbi:Periodic tryptophan protein 2-like protein [Frankliniella fusca]|uniref:Periodic tryptophan protein 2-like protein n=1 Tax=Frankliniella fusca TaxID=407009 RepID=A0AAE1HL95_9NEOP|nr:Periodic tryptophan protein 2-like protein [Frankliniella fusca]
MKFAYKFSNLFGSVYHRGNLLFTPDGNSVISPVGNRISVFDLRNNKTSTLPVESRFNFTALDLSPDGCILIAVNEEGEAHLISLISGTTVHKYRFKRKVRCVRFSPDGKHFAACKENNVFVFKSPGPATGEFNPFIMERVFHGAFDDTTCLDWSSDSKILAVGSKDMCTKLYSLQKFANFRGVTLGSHSDAIRAVFFEKNSLDLITVARNGHLCIWESSIEPADLEPWEPFKKKVKEAANSDSEDDIPQITVDKTSKESKESKSDEEMDVDQDGSHQVQKLTYKRLARHYLNDLVRADRSATLTSASYHAETHVLVTGFSCGSFFLHEMPNVTLIHSLSISDQVIASVALNAPGDWIALGCSGLGQLLVWEWQSETYVMKQQGHANNMTCLAYSSDGQYVVTGGGDGKVKLWNTSSGFCFVTFHEHTAAVTGVQFSHNRKFVVTSSLDGTVRAFDMTRYRNFRTLTSPRPVQFTCVALDRSGDFIAAGGQDVFEIYLWSIKLGRLLEILSGHEGPVSSIAFSPSPTSTAMASVSWDKTLRLWNAIESGSAHDTVSLPADGLFVTYRPDGEEVAVATLDAQVSFFNAKTGDQKSCIEGRNDLGSGRSDTDLVTAKQTLKGKAFNSLCYSADGENILAGGQSKNVCIYNVKESMLVKKFEITQNRSFDAVDDFVNRRNMTEFGNLALVEEREEAEGGNVALKLPGVRSGDMASRNVKPEVRVFSLQFSPTGQAWSAVTTEGLLVYSLDMGLVFDPFMLELGVTPESTRKTLKDCDYAKALMMAVKMNEQDLIREVVETIPVASVELTVSSMPPVYQVRALKFVAASLESTRHIDFYLQWSTFLLNSLSPGLLRDRGSTTYTQLLPVLLTLQKALTRKHEELGKICDFNKYTLRYLQKLGELRKDVNPTKQVNSEGEEDDDSSEMDDEELMLMG